MTLKFNRILEFVELHVRAKFHQSACSRSWVIVLTNKKNNIVRRYRPGSKNERTGERREKRLKSDAHRLNAPDTDVLGMY